jgi:hypothetical protein
MGTLTFGACAVALATAGIGIQPWLVFPVTAAAATVLLMVRRRLRPTIWQMRPRGGRRVGTAVELVICVAYVPVAASVLRLAGATSLLAWDGWAIWALKAQALYVDGDVLGPVFGDSAYVGSHPEYPVLQPALAAASSESIGRFDSQLIDVVPVWGVLRTLIPPWVAAAVGLGAMSTWVLVVNVTDFYADATLAVVVAVGVLCFAIWVLTHSGVALGLGTGLLSISGLVKSEGLVFSIAALVALTLAGVLTGRASRALVAVWGLTIAPALLWLVLRGDGIGPRDFDLSALADTGYLIEERSRLVGASDAMLGHVVASWPTAAAIGVLGLSLSILGRRVASAVFLVIWSSLSFAGLALLYLVSTAELGWHLTTSADRVIFSIALGTGVVAPLLAFDGWDAVSAKTGNGRAATCSEGRDQGASSAPAPHHSRSA